MSVLISIVRPHSVGLLTDGAVYDAAGVLLDVRSKVWRHETLPLGITGRGDADFIERTATALLGLAQGQSVDGFLDIVPLFVDALQAGKGMMPEGAALEILIAAFSESRGPCQFIFATHALYPQLTPYELSIAPDWLVAGPAMAAEDWLAVGLSETVVAEAGDRLLEQHGVQMMEALRRKPGIVHQAHDGSPQAYAIGGHCQLTTVSAAGASTVTLYTWPDKIGEMIDPFAVDGVEEAA